MAHPAQHAIRELNDGSFEFVSNGAFAFEQGGSINPLVLVYETFGRLNADRSNTVLVHHALSTGSHLAASEGNPEPGWWQEMVGPGKPVDTDKFFVICINNLGSCFGSSGPASVNPETSGRYGPAFPGVTMVDIVRSQKMLLEHLGIDTLHAIIGSSMGAMLSITWLALFPDHARQMVTISSCARTYPANQANRLLQREIITSDPKWNGGDYSSNGELAGFKSARKIGLLTYRNPAEINDRFLDKSGSESVESYLNYNAEKFVNRFDCNSYLTLLGAMDAFDLRIDGRGIIDVFRRVKTRVLVISVDSDVLFPPSQQQELYEMLSCASVDARFIAHHSDYGHDAFLVEIDDFGRYIRSFIDPDAAASEHKPQCNRVRHGSPPAAAHADRRTVVTAPCPA